VKGYLHTFRLCLITNLREFALTRLPKHGGTVEIVMRYPLAAGEAEFWDAPLARPKDLADALARYAREALARYAREALRRLEHGPESVLNPLRGALSRALGLRFEDEQGEHFFCSSLVQTLFYGHFSAWVAWSHATPGANPEDFRWGEADDYLHLPVLRELSSTSPFRGSSRSCTCASRSSGPRPRYAARTSVLSPPPSPRATL
jgi:hypothetical protein